MPNAGGSARWPPPTPAAPLRCGRPRARARPRHRLHQRLGACPFTPRQVERLLLRAQRRRRRRDGFTGRARLDAREQLALAAPAVPARRSRRAPSHRLRPAPWPGPSGASEPEIPGPDPDVVDPDGHRVLLADVEHRRRRRRRRWPGSLAAPRPRRTAPRATRSARPPPSRCGHAAPVLSSRPSLLCSRPCGPDRRLRRRPASVGCAAPDCHARSPSPRHHR